VHVDEPLSWLLLLGRRCRDAAIKTTAFCGRASVNADDSDGDANKELSRPWRNNWGWRNIFYVVIASCFARNPLYS
jgi:hypothetical protein